MGESDNRLDKAWQSEEADDKDNNTQIVDVNTINKSEEKLGRSDAIDFGVLSTIADSSARQHGPADSDGDAAGGNDESHGHRRPETKLQDQVQQMRHTRPFYRVPQRVPFSIPEPHLFPGSTMREVRDRNKGKKEEDIPVPTWYADRAAPPLLLTLDAFDTLYTPLRPVAEQYTDVARELGYKVDEQQVQELFRNAYKSASKEFPNCGSGAMGYRKWWGEVIERTFESIRPASKEWPDQILKDTLFRRFSTREGYRMFPDARQLLALIGTSWQARLWPPKRTMLGIISNSDPRVRTILKSFDLESAPQKPSMYPPRFAPRHRNHEPQFGDAEFAFSTLSYECGYEKPSPSIFNRALKDARRTFNGMPIIDRLTRSGKDVLRNIDEEFHHMHVGDSLEKDIVPALSVGWDAVLLDRSSPEAISERETMVDSKQFGETRWKYTVINSLMSIPEIVTKERLRDRINARVGREVYREKPIESVDPLKTLDKIRPPR